LTCTSFIKRKFLQPCHVKNIGKDSLNSLMITAQVPHSRYYLIGTVISIASKLKARTRQSYALNQIRSEFLSFNSLKDMIKTANITAALIRNVAAPRKWYKNPPTVNPIILAKLPKLPAIPCTAP
jgi:hypothetical protein